MVRSLMLSTILLGFITTNAAFAAAQSVPDTSPGILQQGSGADFYTFKVGDVRVTALSDGTVPLDLHKLLHGITKEQIDEQLAHAYQFNPVETSITAFLLEMGDRLILVDTGAGELFGPGFGGKLFDSLQSVGFDSGDVTDILLTHIHSDHIGGLFQNGEIAFPNAMIHVGKPDLDFFLDRKNAERSNYDTHYFDQAIQIMTPYINTGKMDAFDKTTEILPGITTSLHPGHTPGSAFYTLVSQGQKLTFVGDIIHAEAVQFSDPSVAIAFDVNPKTAVAVRSEAFSTFANDSELIAAPHLPFPGIGHVRKAQEGYDWVPINYGNREIKNKK